MLSFVHHHVAAINTMNKGLQGMEIVVNAARRGKQNSQNVGNQQNTNSVLISYINKMLNYNNQITVICFIREY
jgi:hypothetical protein